MCALVVVLVRGLLLGKQVCVDGFVRGGGDRVVAGEADSFMWMVECVLMVLVIVWWPVLMNLLMKLLC